MVQNDNNSAKINIRGVYFDNVTMDEALAKAVSLIGSEGFSYMVTPNSEIVEACVENPALYDVINAADLIIPDGAGVVYASKILKTPLKQKVAGVELAAELVKYAAQNGIGLYFLGGAGRTADSPAVWEKAAATLRQMYPTLAVSGHDGYFHEEETDDIIADIHASGAAILFVCLGAPKQEKWIYQNRSKLTGVRFAAGLGGTLDIFAGTAKRAPEFYIKHNLEWFYRLTCNPSRLGRMMKLPKFLAGTVIHGNRPVKK